MPSFVRAPRRPFRDRGEPSSSTTLSVETNIPDITMTPQEVSPPASRFEADADVSDENALSGSLDEQRNR